MSNELCEHTFFDHGAPHGVFCTQCGHGCPDVGMELNRVSRHRGELVDRIEELEKLVSVSPDDIAAVVDENDRMRRAFSEAIAKLKAGLSVRFSSCEWCGESWPKLDGCTAEEVEANARRHVYACKRHPMKAERDALSARLALLEPVWEAAKQWRRRGNPDECWELCDAIDAAVAKEGK